MKHPNRRRAFRRFTSSLAIAAGAVAFAGSTAPADAGLMIDLRPTSVNGAVLPRGTHDVTVAPGDVVTVQVVAVVSGANNVNDEGFQSIHGAIRSSTGGLLLDMTGSFVTAPFNGNGAQNGSSVDSDADGDLDIGGPVIGPGNTFFIPRANTVETNGTPIAGANPAAEEFVLGGFTFTVTGTSGELFITFIRRANPNGSDNIAYSGWVEDGVPHNGLSPYTVRPIVVGPEPGSATLLAAAASVGLLARRRGRGQQT